MTVIITEVLFHNARQVKITFCKSAFKKYTLNIDLSRNY
jgi:hypothetical protein